MRYSHLSVAIPLLAELENLPSLLQSLESQSCRNFELYLCVNNPADWSQSNNRQELSMYENNMETIDYLQSIKPHLNFKLTILNCQWDGRQHGVGWARKRLFDRIAQEHNDNEVTVSLDADTEISPKYLESVLDTLNTNPGHNALCLPYYHPLGDNEQDNRAMLRYEIYMRHYMINLLESDNPYAFTALGSAMAFPLWAYRRVGGITPLQGGEDFYLMQKFAKTGKILLYCNETVKPQARQSLRVPFGTGPAIAKGIDSMDDAYPLYPHEGFESVSKTFSIFPDLYDNELETPMSDFLRKQLRTDNLWEPLRKNFKTKELFVHACQERVDGLRILQYLKTFPLRPAEEELKYLCNILGISVPDDISFINSSISKINVIRDALFETEGRMRRN